VSEERHGDDYARGARRDFAVNVLADPHPPWLAKAITRGLERAGTYPDPAAALVATAARHGRTPDEVVLLNGAAEGFSLIARALGANRPVIVHPAFTEPERALREAGFTPAQTILTEPFLLDSTAVPGDADLVVLGNPTNPTGALHPAKAVQALCRPGRTTVVDEAFMDFVPGQAGTLAAERLPGLIVVRSLTKVLGIPGIRAGYLLAEPAVATRLRVAAPKWPVNSIALSVIEVAPAHIEHFERVAASTHKRRESLAARLEAIDGVRVHPGHANFLLLELDDAAAAHRRLLDEHGIATRPCWAFPGLDGRHLRVAVHGDPLDAELVAALAAICARPASSPPPTPAQPRR
jgi:histidinol-phosphate aminotransferase